MKRILITGGSGFLGSRAAQTLAGFGVVWAPARAELDFTNADSARRAFASFAPTHLLHCGAVSSMKRCESDPATTARVNCEGPAILARLCAAHGARLLLCSTDQIYEGTAVSGSPHREHQSPCPRSVYGMQKLQAEQSCAFLHGDTVILRLSWMYDAPGRHAGDLAAVLRQAALCGKAAAFSASDLRGVTCVDDVAQLLPAALELPAGVWNFGSPNNGAVSMLGLARAGLEALGADPCLAVPQNGVSLDLRMDASRTAAAGICFADTVSRLRQAMRESV